MGCTSSREVDPSLPTDQPPAPSTPVTTQTRGNTWARHPPGIGGAPVVPGQHRSFAGQTRTHSSSPRTSNISAANPTAVAAEAKPAHIPLKTPEPWSSTTRTWSRAQLAAERSAFFETRVTGRAEIWAAIQSACELLRSGQLENARGLVEAADVTLPTGNLAEGGYDAWGALYRVPKEVLSDPSNVVEEEDADGETVVGSVPIGKGLGKGEMTGAAGVVDLDEADQEIRREEKGKGKAVVEKDAMRVRCRLSDRGGPDVVIMLGRSQSVGVLTTRVVDEADIPNTARIRIAYLGKILDEKETLLASGWKEGHVVNALVIGQA